MCLDASFVLEMLFSDDHSLAASDHFLVWADESRTLFSPPLFYAEVSSAIRGRVSRKLMTHEGGSRLLKEALSFPVTIWPDSRSIQTDAFELAHRFNRPKAYDAQYLALASRLGCELWTADKRLFNTVSHELPWVRWIGAAA